MERWSMAMPMSASMSTSLKLVVNKSELGNFDIIQEGGCSRGKYEFGCVGLVCQLLCLKSCQSRTFLFPSLSDMPEAGD